MDNQTKELRNAVSELRDTVETRLEKEREEFGEELSDTKAKTERINERIDQLETKIGRREPNVEKKDTMSEGREAFVKWLQRENLDSKQANALVESAVMPEGMSQKDITVGTSGNQSDALAPEEFVREIIKDAVEISPVRQVARTRQTDSRQVKLPQLQGRPTAQYVSETGTRPRDTSTDFGDDPGDMLVIDMHEFTITVPISRQMERDSVFDIEAEVREVVMTEMARFEGEKFLQGSGSGAAQGLITSGSFNTLVTSDTSTDAVEAISADEVLDLSYEVKKTYRDNGTYGLTREGLKHVRTLKDQDDQYLWQPGLGNSEPSTINGSPYVEMQDLVSSASAGQGDVPIVFGDFNRGYLVVDRLGMQVLRDPYSNKETGTIDYQFYAAHGGDLREPEALQGLEIG
jgi:HK97 family phage major capsid protein